MDEELPYQRQPSSESLPESPRDEYRTAGQRGGAIQPPPAMAEHSRPSPSRRRISVRYSTLAIAGLAIASVSLLIILHQRTNSNSRESVVLQSATPVPEAAWSDGPSAADFHLIKMIENTGGAGLDALADNLLNAYRLGRGADSQETQNLMQYQAKLKLDQARYADPFFYPLGYVVDTQQFQSNGKTVFATLVDLETSETEHRNPGYLEVFSTQTPSEDDLRSCAVIGYVSDRTMRQGDLTALVVVARAIINKKELFTVLNIANSQK